MIPLTKKDFENLSIHQLLQTIWEYFYFVGSRKVDKYLEWNLETAFEKWPENFPNFNFVMCKIRKQDQFFFPGPTHQEFDYILRLIHFEKEKKGNYFN